MRSNYVVMAMLGGGLLLLVSRLMHDLRATNQQLSTQLSFPMNNSSTTDTSQQIGDASAVDSLQSTTLTTAEAASEESTENNPLKRFQDLVNSPTTPDGHKVVAAVAAASTVTVAAVANWLMKATKK